MSWLDMSAVPDEVLELIERVKPDNVMKTKQRLWHVYAHVSKIDGKKYIGMTCRDPKERWRPIYYVYSPIFYRAIEEHGFDSFWHVVLVSVDTREKANYFERYFVKYWDTQNLEHGYNIASGGNAKWELSENAEKKRHSKTSGTNSPAAKAVALFDLSGKRIADFGTITECARHLGLARDKFRFNYKGTVKGHIVRYAKDVVGVDQLPPEELTYPHAQYKTMKKVNQYDLDGHYITTFPSIASAAASTGKKSTLRLYKALTETVKTAYGYQWRYADSVDGNSDIAPFVSMQGKGKRTPVDMIDIETGEIVRSFDSIAEACIAIGTKGAKTTFYEWMHGKKHPDNIMYGYRWKTSDMPGEE